MSKKQAQREEKQQEARKTVRLNGGLVLPEPPNRRGVREPDGRNELHGRKGGVFNPHGVGLQGRHAEASEGRRGGPDDAPRRHVRGEVRGGHRYGLGWI